MQTLCQVWQRHFRRKRDDQTGIDEVQLTPKQELPPAAEAIESPYDTQARFRTRDTVSWTGYMVHLTESCDDETPHLITHVHTTQATVHEAQCTQAIQAQLVAKDLSPAEQLVDAAYIDADLLVQSQAQHNIALVGPTRPNNTWQAKTAGAYTIDDFVVDWDKEQVRCPQDKLTASWTERIDHTGTPYIAALFSDRDCHPCPARALCTRKAKGARRLKLQPQAQYLALQQGDENDSRKILANCMPNWRWYAWTVKRSRRWAASTAARSATSSTARWCCWWIIRPFMHGWRRCLRGTGRRTTSGSYVMDIGILTALNNAHFRCK